MSVLTKPSWQLGTFAFESDMIDSGQFGRAMIEWSGDPQQDLIRILVEQRSLSAEDVPLLEALWQEQQSRSGRSTFGQALDPTLDGSSNPASGNPQDLPDDLYKIAPNSGEGQRYHNVQPLAAGGLGQVFIAHDNQLDRKVALKEINPRLANDRTSCQRFMREARITGALEHVAIAPVFSMGRRENGIPFYAMRLIEGRTLKDAVNEYHANASDPERYQSVEFRRLLQSFLAVCQAIEFAHSRGVIHRDIKPANVVLGEHGETTVVDWGLAKFVGTSGLNVQDQSPDRPDDASGTDEAQPGELTADGLALGTPTFMSPEQASGQTEVTGPASDVFSLGATLYYLLTNHAPYHGKLASEILAQAMTGQYRAPRHLQPGIPGPLEAICLKAMAREPADRYPSAASLFADVECWMSDQPVSAWPEPATQRIGRLLRRHRTLARAVTAAVLVLAVVSTVFSFLLRQQVQIAKVQRNAAVGLSVEKTALAEKERLSRDVARKQSRLALDTIKSVVYGMQSKLAAIPAAHETRRQLLGTALTGLERVATSLKEQAEVDRDTMVAYNLLGMTYLVAGDIEGQDAMKTALAHFESALAISQQLVADQPEDATALRDLSIVWEHIGDVQIELGTLELAENAYREALSASEQDLQTHSDDDQNIQDVAFGWEKIGDICLKREHVTAAREAVLQSQVRFLELATRNPDNYGMQRDAVVAMQKAGNLYLLEENFSAAADSYRACLDAIEQQLQAGNTGFQPRDRSVLFNKLGNTLRKQNLNAEAAAAYQSGLEISRSIVAGDPGSAQSRRDLTISLNLVADTAWMENDFTTAKLLLDECLPIRRKLAEEDSSSFTAQTDLAAVLAQLGKVEQSLGNDTTSRQYWQLAWDILAELGQDSINQYAEIRRLRDEIQTALD